MFRKKTNFELEHLSQPLYTKSWYNKVKLNTYKSWVIYYLLNLPPSLLILFSETTANLLVRAAGKKLASWKNSFWLGWGFSKSNCKIYICYILIDKYLFYIFVNFTNDFTPSWLWCLHDLVLSRLLFEPASDCRKTKVNVA